MVPVKKIVALFLLACTLCTAIGCDSGNTAKPATGGAVKPATPPATGK